MGGLNLTIDACAGEFLYIFPSPILVLHSTLLDPQIDDGGIPVANPIRGLHINMIFPSFLLLPPSTSTEIARKGSSGDWGKGKGKGRRSSSITHRVLTALHAIDIAISATILNLPRIPTEYRIQSRTACHSPRDGGWK